MLDNINHGLMALVDGRSVFFLGTINAPTQDQFDDVLDKALKEYREDKGSLVLVREASEAELELYRRGFREACQAEVQRN